MEMKLSILFLIKLFISINGEVYTSTQDLTNIFSLERKLVGALGKYLEKTESRLARIRKYLREYEQVSADWMLDSNIQRSNFDQEATVATMNGHLVGAESSLHKLAENPIHAFHLMKRLTVDWKHIGEHPPSEDWQGVADVISESENESYLDLPTEEDLHGAAQALVRLQDVYQLNMTSLARGNVWGIQGAAELTAQDCLYMGKHSFNLRLYTRAIEWFEEAYTLAGLEKNTTVTQEQVMSFITTANKALEENEQIDRNLDHKLQEEDISNKQQYRLGRDLTYQEDADNFQALCRGERLMSAEQLKDLKCYRDSKGNAYNLLMPFKIERVHRNPDIVIYHDIISDQEVEQIKNLSRPLLARAMVQGMKGKGNSISSTRTSKSAWLHESVDPLVGKLAERISDATGLSTNLEEEHAEMLQVANYGIGGHYNPHHDYLLADKSKEDLATNIHPRELSLGDRIATFMFYLSDVERGGATAFPRLGVALWPKKGSAAFWYNLKESGEGDNITLHGACPVVVGSKWVSNQWIRAGGQFLARPCGLVEGV